MKKIIQKLSKLEKFRDLPLLVIRFTLAYSFYSPAIMKWKNIDGVTLLFKGMNYPFPTLNVYLVATIELLGVILLALGIGTRLISIPLMFIMLVAIFTVHLSNGFSAENNGFEISFYYLVMLFTLLIYGSGKYSLENFLCKK